MPTWAWIVIAIGAALLVALVAAAILRQQRMQQRRGERLRGRYGPEYDRTVSEQGRRAGEAELERREEFRERLDIVPLATADRNRYLDSWREIQERFVDQPSLAVREADSLVADVMRRRGYPLDNFEQRAADISVDHPEVVENYRAAHSISQADERDEASTEDLRQAMVHYRVLFEELLETREAVEKEVQR